MAEFRYYMLRVRREPDGAASGPEALGGVVERLGSGEKHGFANAQELLHLLGTPRNETDQDALPRGSMRNSNCRGINPRTEESCNTASAWPSRS